MVDIRKHASTFVFLSALAAGAVACAIALPLYGFAMASNDAAISVNDRGQTYGSMYDAQVAGAEIPDLVSAVASNGESGFMYYEDYRAIVERDVSLTPEELDRIIPIRNATMAQAFKDAADKYYGYDLVSFDCALEAIEMLPVVGGTDAAKDKLRLEVEQAVAANQQTCGLPIVEVGENRTALEAVSANAQASVAALAANAEGVIREVAISQNSKLDGSMPSSYTALMSDFEYSLFYEAAKESVGVRLPVYESDGTTVIGEIVIDAL